jgi:ABC-2 family transporter protein
VSGALFPFALSFLLPVFMHIVVLEKERGLRTAMRLQGVTTPFYWSVTYVFSFIVYVLVVAVFLGIELAMGNRFFTQTSPLLMVLLLTLWGFAQVSFSFFLASFFKTV